VSACFSPGVYAYLKHPPAELDTVFRQSRYVFVDKEEVGKLTGITNNPERAGRTLLDRFPDCQAVIVTLAEGLEINPSSSYEVLHPSFQRKPTKVLTSLFIEHDKVTAVLAPEESNRPKVENVTNAGDVYRGTLQFYALLLGLPWPEATARADIGARFGISGFGLGRLATYDQIEERFCAEYGANPEATTLRARRR